MSGNITKTTFHIHGVKMRFAHLADCHLGGWRHPELQELNMLGFRKAIETCIKEKVDFVLIAGDLFDSAYPPIDTLKQTFSELKKLKDKKTPCFIISGSHDYSASGKTFLDVLEKAGFCKNVYSAEERNNEIILNPTIYENVAIYGYPGKKAGLEVRELKRVKLQEAPGFFKIFMLHTSIKGAIGSLPIESVDESLLPDADYYALGHLHIDYREKNMVYSGPTFPNNFQELEELKGGSFYIIDTSPLLIRKINLQLKKVIYIDLEIQNALIATEKILFELGKYNLHDKVVLLRLSGELIKGKTSNIDFIAIENYVKQQGAYAFLRSTSKLIKKESEISIDTGAGMDNLEDDIIKKYTFENPSEMNYFIEPLMSALSIEKKEDEKTVVFTERLLDDVKKILKME